MSAADERRSAAGRTQAGSGALLSECIDTSKLEYDRVVSNTPLAYRAGRSPDGLTTRRE